MFFRRPFHPGFSLFSKIAEDGFGSQRSRTLHLSCFKAQRTTWRGSHTLPRGRVPWCDSLAYMTLWITRKRTKKEYHIHICIWLRKYIYIYICAYVNYIYIYIIYIYNYIHVDGIYWIYRWFCGYQPRFWMGVQDGREWQSGKVVFFTLIYHIFLYVDHIKDPKFSSSCLSVCTILKISVPCFCRKFPNEKKSGRSWKQPWSQWLGVGRKISKSKKLRRTLSWFFLQDYVVGHKSVSRKCWESKNLRI